MKFINDWKTNNFKSINIHPHLLSKYGYFKLECHFIMIDNEIVIIGENVMMG